MTKRKKRDPLAALKKKHPGPWKVIFRITQPYVVDANGEFFLCVKHEEDARAIARLGAK